MILNKLSVENSVISPTFIFTPAHKPAKIEIKGVVYNRKADLIYNLETVLEKYSV